MSAIQSYMFLGMPSLADVLEQTSGTSLPSFLPACGGRLTALVARISICIYPSTLAPKKRSC